MTAQHHEVQPEVRTGTPDQTDPIGPITLPKRSPVGARAMALVGTVGVSAFAAVAAAQDTTWPTFVAR